MGTALPGPPVSTAELLQRVATRFGVAVTRRGTAFADKLKIETRHLCRDFAARHEVPRPGHSNPELAVTALRAALEDAHLGVGDLAYLIGHTTSPARLVPPNIALVQAQYADPLLTPTVSPLPSPELKRRTQCRHAGCSTLGSARSTSSR
jgi:3-oxoacyl-[acyl-carrier-protein] synthase III